MSMPAYPEKRIGTVKSIRAFADLPVIDAQGHVPTRCRLRPVGQEFHPHRDFAGGQVLFGDLGVHENGHHRIGVGELAVLDVESESPEVICLCDDDTFRSSLRYNEVGTDAVGAIVNLRNHAGKHVLDVTAELEGRIFRNRRHHAEERRERREQRQHLVAFGFLPEQILELLYLLGMIDRKVFRL